MITVGVTVMWNGVGDVDGDRKCASGEGQFMFQTLNNEADVIFERVQQATRNRALTKQGDVHVSAYWHE